VNMDNQLESMVLRFRKIMEAHQRHLERFCAYGVQLEGWLKGELLCFLDEEKARGRIVNFDREVQFGSTRQKVDFCLELPTGTFSTYVWIEAKHWLIGYQKGYKLNPLFYFGDPTSVGIKPDVEKLTKIKEGSKYLLVLATANPREKEWFEGVEKFNQRFAPLSLMPLTNPAKFPSSHFIGLLEVRALV